ncbi:MAG: hypothetical protein IGS03_06750 [Candidatus Sericytochromatia bacterium]|nr:hypothetical protein [Candidatus Sericytochromatia bacterium]
MEVSMDAVLNNVMSAAVARGQTQERYALAVVEAAQDVQQQQAAAAVALIEAAGESLIDVRV